MREDVDQIIHAQWVIPVTADCRMLEQHSVVTRGERIVDVLPQDVCRNRYQSTSEHTLANHAVIPGLINVHTHAAMTLMRGLADDLPLQEWLEQHIWPIESKFVDRQFVYDGTLLATTEMLKSGTTCFNDMYFFPDEVAAAALEVGIRAVVGMIAIGFPSAWANNYDEYLTNGQRVHDQYRSHPLISTSFAPHAPYTVDDSTLKRIATLAEELDVPINIHLHETQDEVDQHVATHGVRPLERLEKLGLLTPRLIAVHMTTLIESEITAVAKYGVSVGHCPESNLKLASGFCPVQALTDAGVNVAIGTDGAASNNDLDMFSEMRTAALLAKGVAGDACAAPAASVLHMATLGGAEALGLDEMIGSLEIGKFADIVALDLDDVAAQPVYDPISQIVYAGHRDQVRHVWVAGRHVVKDGHLTHIDENSVKLGAQRWQRRIAAEEAHHTRTDS